MKYLRQWQYALLLMLSLSAALTGCKKDEKDDPAVVPPQPGAPTVTNLDPATAPVGTTIAITGTGFSTDPASNTVTFNGVQATIVNTGDTRIVVVVPAGATNGAVSVATPTGAVQTPSPFTVAPSTPPVVSVKPIAEKRGTIRANQIWRKDSIYLLRGLVYIPADQVLTIEPGTIIKGAGPDQDPDGKGFAGTLIIERRARLTANGTQTQPIVFTSAKPAGQRNYGDWGGVVLLGKAAVNRPGSTPIVGGIRGTTETYWEFDDNSGAMQYVRIEFAGATQPATMNGKLDGLVLNGVGYQTNINHIQVSYSGNDAFKWYGGTVNVKNIFAYRSQDDDFSADWGYYGKVQFGVGLRDTEIADPSKSNGIEAQNFDPGENGGAPLTKWNGLPQTAPAFANMSLFAFNGAPNAAPTLKVGGIYQAGVYVSRNANFTMYNSVISGYPEGVRVEGSTTGALADLNNGNIDLRNVVIANTLTSAVGGGDVSSEYLTNFIATGNRANEVVPSSDLAKLLLNSASFNLTAPNFIPQSSSPLLTGAASGGKLADPNFTPVTYKGAFGTENWLQGWTNFDPQNTDYDR